MKCNAWTDGYGVGSKYSAKCEVCGKDIVTNNQECYKCKSEDVGCQKSDKYELIIDSLDRIDDLLDDVGWTDIDSIKNAVGAYKSLSKNNRGDIIAPKGKKANYILNPFTNEKVPVYSEEEAALLEDLYEYDEQILEHEAWLLREPDAQERVELRRDIERLETVAGAIKKNLNVLRNEDEWSGIREKQSKAAQAKEKKAKDAKEKKAKAQSKVEKIKEKERKEREKIIKEMPDDLREAANGLFN